MSVWYHCLVAMTLRLDAEDEQLLTDLAKGAGVSKQVAVVQAIRETAQQRAHERLVSDASARARVRWARVIDKLGQ